MVERQLGKHQEALEKLQKCLEIRQKIDGKSSVNAAQAHNNIAMTYQGFGDNGNAYKHLNKSLQILEELK